jgi:hypothetical protein
LAAQPKTKLHSLHKPTSYRMESLAGSRLAAARPALSTRYCSPLLLSLSERAIWRVTFSSSLNFDRTMKGKAIQQTARNAAMMKMTT